MSSHLNPLNIVLLTKDLGWAGGIDMLRLYANALIGKKTSQSLNLFLLAPQPDSCLDKIKSLLYPYKLAITSLFYGQIVNKNIQVKSFNTQAIIKSFQSINNEIKVIYYPKKINGLQQALKKINGNVVLPLITPPDPSFSAPWIGWIFDLQHKFYPKYFSKKEILDRNKRMSDLLNSAKVVITDSKSVKQDIKAFYPSSSSKIVNLPFVPTLNISHLSSNTDVSKKYSLPKKYFAICNQFWVHKSHITAFEALAKLIKSKKINDIHIVCTGKTNDYRFPDYFNQLKKKISKLGLSDKVHILGFIPKSDQLQIVKQAIALLQPTLFEGSPGGLSVRDAISLGTPVITSDIKVNKEVIGSNLYFFTPKSANSLASQMYKIICHPPTRPTLRQLRKENSIRLDKLGTALLKSIKLATN